MINRRGLFLAVAFVLSSFSVAAADPLGLDFGAPANPIAVGPNWQYTYQLTLSSITGTSETMNTGDTLTIGPFAGFVSAGAPAGWTGALVAGNLVYTPTVVHSTSGGIGSPLVFTFTPVSFIGPNLKVGSWSATYENNSGNQNGFGTVPVPTPEPWNVLSAFAMILPVGLLYKGLRRSKSVASSPA